MLLCGVVGLLVLCRVIAWLCCGFGVLLFCHCVVWLNCCLLWCGWRRVVLLVAFNADVVVHCCIAVLRVSVFVC